jgi:hypothetical protein
MYTVFGLNVRSDIALEGLPLAAGGREADVDIVEAAVPRTREEPTGYSLSPAGTLLRIDRVGRFLIEGGHRITVEPDQHSSVGNVRAFLLGSAFGALLHQRGLMPLHANAILVSGRVVAFCGHSGAGKSTIAAWFHDRGYSIFADDVCVIGLGADGRPRAHPGIPRIRLWREALEASGRRTQDYPRSFDHLDKYDVPTGVRAPHELMPLDRVYLLRKAPAGDTAERFVRLSGVEAVDSIVSNTYRGSYLRTIGRTGDHLMTCVQLARAMPIYRANRLWGLHRFEEQATLLEAHVLEGIESE